MGVRGAPALIKSGHTAKCLPEFFTRTEKAGKDINHIVVDMCSCAYALIRNYASHDKPLWNEFWNHVFSWFPPDYQGKIEFVFDGQPTAQKQEEHERRKATRKIAYESLVTLITKLRGSLEGKPGKRASKSKYWYTRFLLFIVHVNSSTMSLYLTKSRFQEAFEKVPLKNLPSQ